MTVRELIQQLQAYDPNLPVTYYHESFRLWSYEMTVKELQEKLSKLPTNLDITLEIVYTDYLGSMKHSTSKKAEAWDAFFVPGDPDIKVYTNDKLTSHLKEKPGHVVIRNKLEDK